MDKTRRRRSDVEIVCNNQAFFANAMQRDANTSKDKKNVASSKLIYTPQPILFG